MPLTRAEIIAFLLDNGVDASDIRVAEGRGFDALDDLAAGVGCMLEDEAAVRGVLKRARVQAAARERENMQRRRSEMDAQLRPLSASERRRFRDAFDRFDADGSGALTQREFGRAMKESGMFPYRYELDELFSECDKDRSGTIEFDEYCRLVQLYRTKQSCLERFCERAIDLFPCKPATQGSKRRRHRAEAAAAERGVAMQAKPAGEAEGDGEDGSAAQKPHVVKYHHASEPSKESAVTLLQRCVRGRSAKLELAVRLALRRADPGSVAAARASRGLDAWAAVVHQLLGPAAW
ncbi:hypothetical protein EMIHUDRAFT_242073, partial [Emiliania huxleyi CCMP1516]